jgi:hypothetical protein
MDFLKKVRTKMTIANNGLQKLREFCKIGIFLSQEILS